MKADTGRGLKLGALWNRGPLRNYELRPVAPAENIALEDSVTTNGMSAANGVRYSTEKNR